MSSQETIHAAIVCAALAAAWGCGGGGGPAKDATNEAPATADEIKAATRPCGEADKVHTFDLHDDKADEAFVPCSGSGGHDYSGLIKVESIDHGVKITIDARDDEVKLLGTDAKKRDAVIVYPKGQGTEGVEVPLTKTRTGYHGEKVIIWNDLPKLTDEGTKIDVAIFDHDESSGKPAEEMHLSLAVSTGKSCEKAQDENPQEITMGKKGTRDLTDAELGAPMANSAFMGSCGLADSANADICVAVKNGKPLGVSVRVTPSNNKVAACIDRSVRRLGFPRSEKLDVVHQKF